MKQILEELNPWWSADFKEVLIQRKKYVLKLQSFIDKKEVIILTGMRRVGKTTLLKQTIQYLLQQNIQKEHILFVSLDLLALSDYSIYEIVQEYKSMHKIDNSTKVYLFLDEVTYKPHFNQELKNLYDIGNYKIFASSSSASALIDNQAFLTGRAKYLEILPLTFEEFVTFKKYDFNKTSQAILKGLFEDYMKEGGIPEFVLDNDTSYLSELAEFIIEKDIISKHGIKNKKVVYELYKLLCERVGKQISYNNLAKLLSVDNETISRYIQFFLETYLFYQIEVKDKLNVQIKSKKKLYCSDVGMRNVVTGFRDKGAIFENLVYTKLRDEYGKNINFLYKNGIEIDFLVKDIIIEAKYGQELNEKQQKLFDSYKAKQKVIAQGFEFFTK